MVAKRETQEKNEGRRKLSFKEEQKEINTEE